MHYKATVEAGVHVLTSSLLVLRIDFYEIRIRYEYTNVGSVNILARFGYLRKENLYEYTNVSSANIFE